MTLRPTSRWTFVPLLLTLLAGGPDGLAASEVVEAAPLPPPPQTFPTNPPPPQIPVTLRKVAGRLGHVTFVTNAGDDRLFVTQQEGLIFIVRNGARLAAPFLDVRSLVSTGGERGLLSIAFSPDYAENRTFFIAYTNLNGDVTVARYQTSADNPNRADASTARVILRIPKPFPNHNGGQLQFGPDGYLYVSTGDGGGAGDADCNAQQKDTLLGKILRLDVSVDPYTIPATNPFLGSEIWALGLRNPWRFSFDRVTGDLWIGDVGQTRREEINWLPAGTPGGQNFGWKPMEGNRCYSNANCPVGTPPCRSAQFVMPVFDYHHTDQACAVTGGYVARSPSLPHVYGTYFFADLCSPRAYAGTRQADNSWLIRQFPVPQGGFVTFGENHLGQLFTASRKGELFEIVPLRPVDTVALHDPATARFLFKDLHADGAESRAFAFGAAASAEVPLAGDWNGDGRTGVGTWNPNTGTFRLKNAIRPRGPVITFAVTPPSPNAIPLAGDWNGDGKDSVGFYDPSTSTFHLTNRISGADDLEIEFSFGNGGIPVAGDWNGDGKDSVGLYLPGRGLFTLRNQLSGGAPDYRLRYGALNAGWIPLAGDWNGDGQDSVGFYDPTNAIFHLKDVLRRGPDDWTFRFGTPGAALRPLAGEW